MKTTFDFKVSDTVELKEKQNGRLYHGKVLKIVGDELQVSQPNGYYAQLPIKLWKKVNDNE